MSLETDLLVDRRRLRSRITFWRFLAFAAAVLALFGLGIAFAGKDSLGFASQHVARVSISGLITGSKETLKLLDDVSTEKSVAGVVLSIDSGGGTVTGSEALFVAIRKLAAKKPVVAVVDNVAASGAYIAAIGTDHIVSRGSSVVGSIGVIAQYPNLVKLLDTLGIKVESVRSSPIKAMPSGIEATPPEAIAALQATVMDSYAWFKDLVKERRKLSDAELAVISDGRVFTGRQALPLKLVDEIGGEREGIAWLESSKGVAKDLPVRDWKPQRNVPGFPLSGALAGLAEVLGLGQVAQALRQPAHQIEAATLDGLLTIWQPQR
jgi:protease IV